MSQNRPIPPGLEPFWEQAESDGSDEHPLERELTHRLDALVRYDRMIEQAVADGNDAALEHLAVEQEREARLVRRIRDALRGSCRPAPSDPPR